MKKKRTRKHPAKMAAERERGTPPRYPKGAKSWVGVAGNRGQVLPGTGRRRR